MKNIPGLEITENNSSKRILDIKIKEEIINELINLFKRFDLTAIEYKPFTRFTIAKYLDDLTNNELGRYLNDILRDRKAYTNMDLHTDGTYVKEITDWLMMTKIEEKHVEGGESAMLHLDDWEHCKELYNDPIGRENFTWSSPKSKNVDYKVEHPVFFEDSKGLPQISYIDQFPEPKNMKQGQFLQKLSDALEGSKNKVITKLPVGSAIVANNYFWLHGRKPFKENKNLSRELLRIRGSFFVN